MSSKLSALAGFFIGLSIGLLLGGVWLFKSLVKIQGRTCIPSEVNLIVWWTLFQVFIPLFSIIGIILFIYIYLKRRTGEGK